MAPSRNWVFNQGIAVGGTASITGSMSCGSAVVGPSSTGTGTLKVTASGSGIDIADFFTNGGSNILTIDQHGGIASIAASSYSFSNSGGGGSNITDSGGGGITLNDTGSGGVSLLGTILVRTINTGALGTSLVDEGAGGITLNSNNAGGISINNSGGGGGGAITLTNNGSGGTAISDAGAGGVSISDTVGGIQLVDTGGSSGGIHLTTNWELLTQNSGPDGTQITDTGGGGISLNATGGGVVSVSGTHLNNNPAKPDIQGHISSVAGTTVSYAYATAFVSTPTVVVTPTTNAGAFYLSASSNTGFTITYATSGAQTFNYHVIGNPS